MSPYLHAGPSSGLLPTGFLTKFLCPFLFSMPHPSRRTLRFTRSLVLVSQHNLCVLTQLKQKYSSEESRHNTTLCSNFRYVVMYCRDQCIVTYTQTEHIKEEHFVIVLAAWCRNGGLMVQNEGSLSYVVV
jgi:hypothetical protein